MKRSCGADSRAPAAAPARRPERLAENPVARVLVGKLMTDCAGAQQRTLAFGKKPRTLRRAMSPGVAFVADPDDDGVITVVDEDDDGDAAHGGISGGGCDGGGAAPLRRATAAGGSSQPSLCLPPGVVLLRGFLRTLDDQHRLVAAVDGLTRDHLPLMIPAVRGYTGGEAFSNLYMTYAGRYWDGAAGAYSSAAAVPNLLTGALVPVPPVPVVVMELAARAVAEALRASPGAFDSPPFPAALSARVSEIDFPNASVRARDVDRGAGSEVASSAEGADGSVFTMLANYYPRSWGCLSVHSDRSERAPFPVVSMSVGDVGVFALYPRAVFRDGGWDNGPAIDIELRSGDAILFGGASRLIRHEVKAIREVGMGGLAARPPGLCMVPGRLNVTLRTI